MSAQVWLGVKLVTKRCPVCGGFISDEAWSGVPKPKVKCPKCGSSRNWKDGKYVGPLGSVQRYLCRDCDYRFSEQ